MVPFELTARVRLSQLPESKVLAFLVDWYPAAYDGALLVYRLK